MESYVKSYVGSKNCIHFAPTNVLTKLNETRSEAAKRKFQKSRVFDVGCAVRAQGMRIAFDFINNPNPKVFYKKLVGFICFWIFKFSF